MGAAATANGSECAELGEMLEVTSDGGFGGSGEGEVFPGVHPADKALRTRLKNPTDDLELALVEFRCVALEEPGFSENKANLVTSIPLSLADYADEPMHPVGHLVAVSHRCCGKG